MKTKEPGSEDGPKKYPRPKRKRRSPRARPPVRDDSQDQLTISLSKEMKEDVIKVADREDRSMSQVVVIVMEWVLGGRKGPCPIKPLKADEQRSE